MTPLAQAVQREIEGWTEGAVVTARLLAHLGKRSVIERALRELVENFKIFTISPMTYVLPITDNGRQRWPDVDKVIRSLAAVRGVPIAKDGAASAISLGISVPSPTSRVYVTSGPSETLMIAGEIIEIRRVPRWQLEMSDRPAGAALRAIAHLGKADADKTVQHVRAQLSPDDWNLLSTSRVEMPAWLTEAISSAAAQTNSVNG